MMPAQANEPSVIVARRIFAPIARKATASGTCGAEAPRPLTAPAPPGGVFARNRHDATLCGAALPNMTRCCVMRGVTRRVALRKGFLFACDGNNAVVRFGARDAIGSRDPLCEGALCGSHRQASPNRIVKGWRDVRGLRLARRIGHEAR